MAKNAVDNGSTKSFTAAADVLSGAAVVSGTLLGVAHDNVASGAEGVLHIVGVWELPKLTSANIGDGARLTWDVSDSKFIIASAAVGDLENCAVAVAAAGTSAATVLARLCPGCGTIKAS